MNCEPYLAVAPIKSINEWSNDEVTIFLHIFVDRPTYILNFVVFFMGLFCHLGLVLFFFCFYFMVPFR